MTNPHDQAADAPLGNPFGENAPLLKANGYSPTCIIYRDKRPWQLEWSRLCREQYTDNEIAELLVRLWNVGVACGYRGLVFIDIDLQEPEFIGRVRSILPDSPVMRRGSKGWAGAYRTLSGNPLKSAKLIGVDGKHPVLEILSAGNQVVLPPSIHPDGHTYEWLTERTLLNTKVNELPIIDDDIEEQFRGVLGPWLKEEEPTRPFKNRPRGSKTFPPDVARLVEPLSHIDPSIDQKSWDEIGKMIHAEDAGEAGFRLYNDWSAQSDKYPGEKELRKRWARYQPEKGLGPGSLIEMARKAGWQPSAAYNERWPGFRHKGNGASGSHGTAGETKSESAGAGPGTDGDAKGKATPAPDMSIVWRNQIAIPPFPLEVLGPAGEWVKATAETKSAPTDYVALGLLVTTAAVIGPKRRVSPWEGWEEPSILWGGFVGPPSFNKSPAIDPLQEGVHAIEREINNDWETTKAEYEKEKKSAEAHTAKWEQDIAAAVKAQKTVPDKPEEANSPKVPTKSRLWIVDATTEKVARILGENPGGLLCFCDELSGLLGGFDRYGGSGSDRAFWIKAYGGRPHRYDRVSLSEPVDIAFCAVSLLGGIQPDRLNTMLLSGDDDGLAARFLYAWPDQVRPRRPSRAADNSLLLTALRRLSQITFDGRDEDDVQARIILLESDAADEFSAWWSHKQWDAKLSASGRLAGAVGKLDGITLRLAQVLEFLVWAWRQSNTAEPEKVSLKSVSDAMRIIDSWVRPNLERVFAEASLPQAQRDAMLVGRWLLKTKPEKVNARDLRRQAGFTGPKEAKALDAAIELLVDAHWLISTGSSGDLGGRPRKDYEVNPAIHQTASEQTGGVCQNGQNCQNPPGWSDNKPGCSSNEHAEGGFGGFDSSGRGGSSADSSNDDVGEV